MARCEDFPCCGHAGDPGGCPNFEEIRTCKDCGRQFHPDDLTWDYCYRCGEKIVITGWGHQLIDGRILRYCSSKCYWADDAYLEQGLIDPPKERSQMLPVHLL